MGIDNHKYLQAGNEKGVWNYWGMKFLQKLCRQNNGTEMHLKMELHMFMEKAKINCDLSSRELY